jgi:hypothetical protein
MLTIHLGQDENDCFSAWVSARDSGLAANDAVDQKGKNIYKNLYFFTSVQSNQNINFLFKFILFLG